MPCLGQGSHCTEISRISVTDGPEDEASTSFSSPFDALLACVAMRLTLFVGIVWQHA